MKITEIVCTSILPREARSFEKDIEDLMKLQLPLHPIYEEYLSKIYGIGPIIASGLIAYVGDISKFDNISRLWQYSGVGMNSFCPKCDNYTWIMTEFTKKDGTKTKAKKMHNYTECPECGTETVPKIQRRQAGYISNWNDKFKVLLWKIGQSALKQQPEKSYYRRKYDQFKAEEYRKHPEPVKEGKTKAGKPKTLYSYNLRTKSQFLINFWSVNK